MDTTQTLAAATGAVRDTATAVAGYTRDAFYAGLGVVAVLQEEAEKTFGQLISEGRAVETGRAKTLTAKAYGEAEAETREVRAEAEEAAAEVREAGRKAEATAKAMEDRVAEAVTDVLQRMNVPTREDVDALKRSVERLNKKTLELRAA